MSGKPEAFAPGQLDAFNGQEFALIPLHRPHDRRDGKAVGKAPMRSNWRIAAPMSVDEAKEHMEVGGGNVGVRLARSQLVVDVDPRNFAPGGDSLDLLQNRLGIDFDSFPVVETGGGGRHFYLLKPVEVEVVGQLREFPGVEFKTEGRQVVAPGSIHPDTGRAYRWDALSVPLSEISEAPGALLSAIAKPAAIEAQAVAGVRSPEMLGQLLALLDVGEFADNDSWLKIMMASHHATAGAGRQEFIEWSVSDPAYAHDADAIGRRWDSLKSDGAAAVTEATLFKAIRDAGHGDALNAIIASNDFAEVIEEAPGLGRKSGNGPHSGFAGQYVWIADAERFIRRKDGKALSEKQFKSLYADKWPEGDILTAVWKGKLPIRRLESMAYVPLADEFTRSPSGAPIYNTWRDSRIVPVEGDVAVFLDHIAYLFPDEAERSFVIDYLALLVQRPETKINFALLVQGRQGTGKSWIGLLAARMIGEDNVGRPMNSVVVDKYTDWQEGCQLVIIEELMALGRQEVANRLKPVITDSQLCIRPMYGRAYNLPNHLNLICFTNHADALPIEADDRRWLAVFSPAEPATEAYYDRLFGFLDAGGAAAVAQWLLARKIELNPKGRAPWTRGKEEMRSFTLGEAEQVLAELLAEGAHPFDFELVRLEDVVASVPDRIARSAKGLRSRVIKWLKDEVKAVKHARYTKQGNDSRQPWSLWSIRNHAHWDGVGAAARIDAYLEHAQS
jgi:hypothetical protein